MVPEKKPSVSLFGAVLTAAFVVSAMPTPAFEGDGDNAPPPRHSGQIEQWAGNSYRIKRVPHAETPDDAMNSDNGKGFQDKDNNRDSDEVRPDFHAFRPHANLDRNENNQSFAARDNQPEPDDSASPGFRLPDQFVDRVQTDQDGVRHFPNGKHFDLSAMSIDDAINVANSSTLIGPRRVGGGNQMFAPDNGFQQNQFIPQDPIRRALNRRLKRRAQRFNSAFNQNF